MDGINYCEEREKEHRKQVRELKEQLKRKEQECETLASQLDFEVQKKECLEQECEKLKQTLAEIKEIVEECCYKCNSMNNCNISCKYYNNCNGEFSYLLVCLNKQISECEVKDEK